jgi:replication factor C small subunit
MREDFQQALRRVMEQYHEATQFVIATRQPSALIAPIRSRCYPIPVRAPTQAEIVAVVERIADREAVDYDAPGIEFVAGAAGGNLREAILNAQTTAEEAGEITRETAYDTLSAVDTDERIEELFDDAEAGAFTDARSTLDDLLVDDGYSGEEVLAAMLDVARSRYSGRELAKLHRRAGETDYDLLAGTSDRIHLAHLLADLGEGT